MEYKVISADTHLDLTWLPGDMFVEAAPEHLKSQMPYTTDAGPEKRWIVEKEDIARAGGFIGYTPGHSKHMDRMAEVGFYDGVGQGVYHPAIATCGLKTRTLTE